MHQRSLCSSLFAAALLTATACWAAASGMDDLDAPRSYRSGRISSYDRSGGNNDGSQSERIKAGEMRTIAEITGPGKITHMWFTMFADPKMDLLRDVILRIYWDGERTPSVEVPAGEFFGLGHGKYYTYSSFPIEIGNDKGLNCFFPMPFRKSAKVTVENLAGGEISDFYYFVDYQVSEKPKPDTLYFHAQYRQAKPILTRENYTILDAVGRGHYVGCFLFERSNENGWWGEGDDMIYIDGSKEPVLHGTGVEDYFCHSWGFAENTYALRFGAPLSSKHWQEGMENAVYRFHIEDPIAFRKSFRMTMEHAYGGHNDRADDWSTVAYWYQTEPHAPFPKLASPEQRRSTAERLALYLKQNRLWEYRSLLSDMMTHSTSGHVRNTAAQKLVDSYKSTWNADRAIEALLLWAGPFPYGPVRDAIVNGVKDAGGDPNLVPLPEAFPVENTDGRIINTLMGGKVCQRTSRSLGSPYMYFRVIDKALRNGDRTVVMQVEYYDDGKARDVFRVEYDSAYGDGVWAKYVPVAYFAKTGEKGWHTTTFTLDRAAFTQRENVGADFRIFAGVDRDEYIREIRISER